MHATITPRLGRAIIRRTSGATLLSAIVIGAVLGLEGLPSAHAGSGVDVTASPASIAVGESARIAATGLGGVSTAVFGLDATPGGAFAESGTNTYGAPVSAGEASAMFTASQAGTFTVAVGTGETPLGTVTATVTDAAPPAPDSAASINADPSRVEAGEYTTLTASGLGGLETAGFGMDATTGATFQPSGATTNRSTVTDGMATAQFVATEPGSYSVVVTDGETVLASTVVTVSAAATPQPSPTMTHTADAGDTYRDQPALLWIIAGVIILIIAGASTAWALIARRRRVRDAPTP